MQLVGIILIILGVIWGGWWYLGSQFAEQYKGLNIPFYFMMATAVLPIGLGVWLVLR